jgi:hypothetical protein
LQRRNGFVLVVCLLLSLILLAMGFGFLSSSMLGYRTAMQSGIAMQARECAEAGLTDAREKLHKDYAFPPSGDLSQQVFQYTENFNNVGSYTVTIDSSFHDVPYQVIRITSVGMAGTPGQPPVASCQIVAEFDVAPGVRGSGGNNAHYMHYITRQDL